MRYFLALSVVMWMVVSAIRADDVLATLRKEHPRLLVLRDGFANAKQVAQRDARAKVYYDQIISDSNKLLKQPPVKRSSGQMLNTSRIALTRITFLSALYRMDGDTRFADRARDEMLAIAKFDDWNPSHFLDTAEMTAAMAIGYDWLFEALSPEDRSMIRGAIIEKGLKPGLSAYGSGEWWTKVNHNWANVCAGGLTLGALVIADEEPDLARQVLSATRSAMDKPMSNFAPDGGWPEGPGYWNYATRYTAFYITAYQTALGTDLDLCKYPGFDKTGWFRIHTTGPTGLAFNFADGKKFAGNASQMFWMAKQFNEPAFAVAEREYAAEWGDVFHLLWWNDGGTTFSQMEAPTDALFSKVGVACFRSAWDDRDAFYVGFKGGDNSANHAHLDLGTFVLDAFGQRWATDLGSDNYDLPDYFGKLRWTYYRTRTEGHNTLLIDDQNQDAKAAAPIVAYSSTPQRAFAVADLSEAYKFAGARVLRGIELVDRNAVVIQDEIDGQRPVKVQWNLHTSAGVQISDDKRSADLTQNGKALSARIVSPPEAFFQVIGASPGKPQNPNKGVSNLIVALPGKTTNLRLIVVLAAKEHVNDVRDIQNLEQWR